MAAPLFDICGTAREPVIFAKNVDGAFGRLIAGRTLDELLSVGKTPPSPRGGERDGVVIEWHARKRSRTPWKTGLRVLADLAQQLLQHLQADVDMCERIPALRRQTGWNDTEVLLTTPGCTLGSHTDAQPKGSLLFIFCAGLSCRTQAWPDGAGLVERVLESGDA